MALVTEVNYDMDRQTDTDTDTYTADRTAGSDIANIT